MTRWLSILAVICLSGCLERPPEPKVGPSRPIQPPNEKAPEKALWRITGYCRCEKCCHPFADGITASGHKIQSGDRFVAAPPEIPFGTWFRIEGYNGGEPVQVLDRGGVIKDQKIDVFFNTHQEALNWGVKYYILHPPL